MIVVFVGYLGEHCICLKGFQANLFVKCQDLYNFLFSLLYNILVLWILISLSNELFVKVVIVIIIVVIVAAAVTVMLFYYL